MRKHCAIHRAVSLFFYTLLLLPGTSFHNGIPAAYPAAVEFFSAPLLLKPLNQLQDNRSHSTQALALSPVVQPDTSLRVLMAVFDPKRSVKIIFYREITFG
jgi:hypothetical protein